MKIQKGHTNNPSGRPKGWIEIQKLAREKSLDAIDTLVSIMMNPENKPGERSYCAVALLDRGWGKPKQPTEQEGPMELVITWKDKE